MMPRADHLRKKTRLLLLVVCFLLFRAPTAPAWELFQEYHKVIFIDQLRQVGAAYEDGHKLREFPVLTGDDECPTRPGLYVIRHKDPDYYSRTYDTPMPYSLFFDWRRRQAIHEGGVPPPAAKRELATHGCIHVEEPDIAWLFQWAEAGATAVIISGERSQD